MENYTIINNELCKRASVKKNKIINDSFDVKNFSLMKLRDILYKLGKIEHEDLNQQIYIATIKGGFGHRNTAVTAFRLDGSHLEAAAYAEEGLINQNTAKGVLNEFRKSVSEYIA